MSRGWTLLFLMFLTFSSAYPIALLSAETYTPLLKVTANDIFLTAGKENMIEIEIKNTGSFSVYEVETLLSVPTTTTGITVIEEAHKIFNEIKGGKVKRYNPIIYVDRNTPLGPYTLTYQLSYIKKYKLGSIQPASALVQLGIVVKNVTKPLIRLNVVAKDAQLRTGAEEEMEITMENIGEAPIYEIDTTISSTSPYLAVVEEPRTIYSSLEVGENFTLRPTMAVSRSAPLGVYTFTVTASYMDSEGQEYFETFTLGVNVETIEVAKQTTVVLQKYETEPLTIQPGDVFDLKLELACSGAIAHDLKLSLTFTPGIGLSPLSPTLVALGDLEPGGQTEAIYRLIVDGALGAGQYPATVTLSYLDAYGVPKTLVETVTFNIRGIINFSLINGASITAARGAVTVLEVDLLLIGTESVQFVTIEVVEDETFRRTSKSEEYIGAVDPDSPIPFDLEFKVTEMAEIGDHPLKLRLTYIDYLNQEHESTIELPTTVTEASAQAERTRGSFWGFWLWLRRLFGLLP